MLNGYSDKWNIIHKWIKKKKSIKITLKQLNFNRPINSLKLIKVIKMLQKIYFKACCDWKIQHPTQVKAKVILSFSSLH